MDSICNENEFNSVTEEFTIIPVQRKKKVKKINLEFIIEQEQEQEQDNTEKLIVHLNKAGIDMLVTIYKNEFKRKITNMKCSAIPLDKRKGLIIKNILEAIVKGDTLALTDKIITTYFSKNTEKTLSPEWINEFSLREEILVYNDGIYNKGFVYKINKKSISVRLFCYSEIDDMNAIVNQTYGTNKLKWWGLTNKTKIIFKRHHIIKKDERTYMNELFEQGERRVDYGN